MKAFERRMIVTAMEKLIEDGWRLYCVDDGGEEFVSVDDGKIETAIKIVEGVDVSTVYLNKDGKKGWFQVVLGNDPGETISDYSGHLFGVLDKLLETFDEDDETSDSDALDQIATLVNTKRDSLPETPVTKELIEILRHSGRTVRS